MALPSSSGRRGPRPIGNRTSKPLEDDRARLIREEKEILRREQELRKKHEEIQQRLSDLPKQLEERERKQRDWIRLQTVSKVTTADGFFLPPDKRHAETKRGSTARRRMTKPEERSARLQFLFLCGVLAIILILLWKSLP
jgi:hypothetical protein